MKSVKSGEMFTKAQKDFLTNVILPTLAKMDNVDLTKLSEIDFEEPTKEYNNSDEVMLEKKLVNLGKYVNDEHKSLERQLKVIHNYEGKQSTHLEDIHGIYPTIDTMNMTIRDLVWSL